MGWPRPNLQELASKRFGLWEVIGPAPSDHRGRTRLRCRCHGCNKRTERDVLYASLKRGDSRSCGCRRISGLAASRHRHGHSPRGAKSKTWMAWRDMKRRYGPERVCREWWTSFEAFVADVGEKPSPNHRLNVERGRPLLPLTVSWTLKRETTIPKNVARASRRAWKTEKKQLLARTMA